MRSRPQLALAAVAVGWGSIGVIVREVPLPATVIVGFRVWLAALALGTWVALRAGRAALVPSHRPARTIACGLLLAAHWVALFAAFGRAPIGTVLFITYLAPVGIAALAPLTLGERLSRTTAGALCLGAGGMALVAAPAMGASGAGIALAAAAAALLVALVLVAKPLSEAYGGMRLAFHQLAVAGAALVPVAASAEWSAPAASWLWLLVLGLGHTAVGLGVFYAALARMPAHQVGILGYLEPASAVVFGWLLLSESPGAGTLAGGALIVAAGGLVLLAARERTAGERIVSGGTTAQGAAARTTEVAGVPR